MKINKWTQVLLGVGLVSIPAVTHAEEKISSLRAELTSTTISGYVDTTATWKFENGNANMPGRVYDGPDTQDGFNMNVVSVTLAKPLDESEWAAGYTAQLLFGPGARKRGTGSVIGGIDTDLDGGNDRSAGDVAFNEAVILVRVPVGNGIDFKIGQFGTYNGYEAYDTYKNPNWSRSYGFFLESSAHTGISASYKVCEFLSIMAGVGNMAGFNNNVDAKFPRSESRKAYMAMATFTAPESFGFMKGASASIGYTVGPNGGNGVGATPGPDFGNGWHQDNFYFGLSLPTPVEGLAVGLAFDYTTGIGAPDADAGSIAAYLAFQATEKLKLNTRFDYGFGDNGQFYTAATDGDNEIFSITATADYALWKNVISRLELRWDTVFTSDKPFGGTVAGAPSDKSAVSLTANFIYQF